MFELHSNISPHWPKNEPGFKNPLHETLEITTGITDNSELGFMPLAEWAMVNFSRSANNSTPLMELESGCRSIFGSRVCQRPFSNETEWDYEIRPVVDKTLHKHYISFNPSFDRSFTTEDISFST